MKSFIIAECGINANGDVNLAKNQIDLAVAAGADAVKFQVYNSEKLHGVKSPVYKDAKQGEFSYKNLRILADYSPIEWFATPFDIEAVDLLEDIGVKRYKVASCSLTNWKLLASIAKTGKPVILSTGRHDTGAIGKAVEILGKPTILYCVPNYPTKIKDLNFGRMAKLGELYKLPVGFSDHTTGIWAAIEAVRIGATVVEKHFTVSRSLDGCDQVASLEPMELKLLVKSIRQLEAYQRTL
jgi:sialic acid synthase SpsE